MRLGWLLVGDDEQVRFVGPQPGEHLVVKDKRADHFNVLDGAQDLLQAFAQQMPFA
jgi:hypothetical protein